MKQKELINRVMMVIKKEVPTVYDALIGKLCLFMNKKYKPYVNIIELFIHTKVFFLPNQLNDYVGAQYQANVMHIWLILLLILLEK